MKDIIPQERIESKIFLIRGQKVMLDRDLAELYGVATFNLNKAVGRNLERFPEDFMFQLTKQEYDSLRFQFGMLKRGGHSKYLPFAFTENGLAMLSSVLRSERAIRVNIAIMRAFTRIRKIMATHRELAHKIEDLEHKHAKHELDITTIFKVLKKMLEPSKTPPRKIGFRP